MGVPLNIPPPVSRTNSTLFVPLAERHEMFKSGELVWSKWQTQLNNHIREVDPIYKGLAEWRPLNLARQIDLSAIPLQGLYKETFDVQGFTTSLGISTGFRKYPIESGAFVEALHARNIECIGKAAALAFGTNPKIYCVNPAYPSYSPGGSSTGSGVCVAAGFCDFSLGVDTGGSVRHPSGNCGCVGIKLTHNELWLPGIFSISPNMDSVGMITRSVADLAFIWTRETLAEAFGLSTKEIEKPRLKVVGNLENPELFDPPIWAAWQRTRRILEDAKWVNDEYSLDVWDARNAAWDLLFHELAVSNTENARHSLGYNDFENLGMGKLLSQDKYEDLLSLQKQVIDYFDHLFSNCEVDFLILPLDSQMPRHVDTPPSTVYTPTPYEADPGFTVLANFAKLPAIVLPIKTSSGAPTAIQIWGRRGSDAALIFYAARLEKFLSEEETDLRFFDAVY